jgi:hypothetical protein
MIKRALCVALSLVAALFPAAAQQVNRPHKVREALDPGFALSVYQPKTFNAADRSLLFHKGPVTTWWDGGWLATENALAGLGMASLDLFPVAFLSPEIFGTAPAQQRSIAPNPRSENSGMDGKDLAGQMIGSPLDRVYYGGEVGFLYGQWTGKGGGDMWETYAVGTVGNDKFQITAGAAYDEWNGSGRGLRFRSFSAGR